MIKVNLNKTKSSYYHGTHSTGLASEGTSTFITTALEGVKKINLGEIGVEIFFKMAINLVIIFCFPLALKIYEINQINKLEQQKKQKEEILSLKNQELSSLVQELKNYEHLQEKSVEFSKKKDFLKGLAESRIVIPRTLDLIQNKIPKTVWLGNVKLELLEDKTKIQMSGTSFNETHINAFANSLHDVLDKNSITVNTRDIKDGNSVIKVEFDLQGVIWG